METRASVSPDGTVYPLPKEEEYQAELARIERLVKDAREKGQEIVVVMGVGFVGAVMAAIVADTTDEKGKSVEVRHRHAAAQPEELLEDPAPEQGHLAGQGRRP